MKTKLVNFSLLAAALGLAALNPGLAFAQSANDSYTNTILSGMNLIANQLDHGSNTLDEVLPNVPDASHLFKWNDASHSFHTDSYDGLLGGWIDDSNGGLSTTTLAPGEAAFLSNPGATYSLVFTGQPHVPVLPANLARGVLLYRSRQTNGPGTWENITGLPAEEGALLLRWNAVAQGYQTNRFTGGQWQPGEPIAEIGEGVVIIRPHEPVPFILRQPGSLTVTQGQTATFVVMVTLGDELLSYQWLRNGIVVTGATDSVLAVNPTAQTDDGSSFSVMVSNSGGSVTSSNATLTVVADLVPPALVSAIAFCESNQVVLKVTEPLERASAEASSAYGISSGTILVPVLSAVLSPDGQTVSLSTDPLTPGTSYTLAVAGVRDLAGNVIAPNTQITFQCSPPAAPKVFINEWLAFNTTDLVNPASGQRDDWFELFNPGPNPVDLAGYFLTDSLTNQTKFQVPTGRVLPAGGFLLVWADNHPAANSADTASLHVNFTLLESGGEIGLFAADGTAVDTVQFGVQLADVSEGRWPNGGDEFFPMAQKTGGGSNTPIDPNLGAGCSSKGVSYWLTFPQNMTGGGTPDVLISGCAGASGTLTLYGTKFSSWSVSFVVPPSGMIKLTMPPTAVLTTCDQIVNNAIHVTANSPVSVYGFFNGGASTDGYLALAENVLGTDYLVLSYGSTIEGSWPNGEVKPLPSEFAVVASQDNTTVIITPSISACLHPAGVPYSIVLSKGQTYQLQGNPDLTGTRITAEKPIAVFGAHAGANVPQNPFTIAADYLVEQLPPVPTWGKKFCTAPLATRNNGDTFRVLASVNGTSVSISGIGNVTLNSGQFYEFIGTGPMYISASFPVLIAQYANGLGYDGNWYSDPFMMLVPATRQFVMEYSLATAPPGLTPLTPSTAPTHFTNYLNLVVPSNPFPIAGLPGPISYYPIGGGYYGATVPVPPGTYCLSGPAPFGVDVYGWPTITGAESYGYPADLCLRPNRPPRLNCAGVINDCAPGNGSTLVIPAQVSDADGDALSIVWTVDGNTVPFNPAVLPAGTSLIPQVLNLSYFFSPGSHVVTITVSDGNSAPVTCTCLVFVAAPLTIQCPDIVVEIPCGNNTAVVNYQVTASGYTQLICTPPPGSTFPLGVTVVTCTAINGCGQSVSCSFKVIVKHAATKVVWNTGGAPGLAANFQVSMPGNGTFVPAVPTWVYGLWMPDDAVSQWVSYTAANTYFAPAGLYIYRLTFNLPAGVTGVSINGRFAVDNAVPWPGVLLNGQTKPCLSGTYNAWTPININGTGFQTGLNTLDIPVFNLNYWTGFRAELTNSYLGCPPFAAGLSRTNLILPGRNLIANPLDRGFNRLDEVLPNVPDGSQLEKWDAASQQFHRDIYSGSQGRWTDAADGNPSTTTLGPSEAAFLLNPGSTAYPLVFTGEPHWPAPPPPLLLRNQLSFLSSPVGERAGYLDLTGLAPEEGAQFLHWNPITQSYQTNRFTGGAWQLGEPVAEVGEGVAIWLPLDITPPVLSHAELGSGMFLLSFEGARGQTYVVEYKNTFADSSWTPLETVIGTGLTSTVIDPGPLPSLSRFYRVRLN